MTMKHHGGLPPVWNDSASPAFAQGAGAAAPATNVDFIAATGGGGSDANELRLPTYTASTNDRGYATIQIMHDLRIPASGNVIFRPHVHWTLVAEPTTGRTVVWELHYVYAKVGATFAAAVATLTADAYTTTGEAEIRKHQITSLGDISVPVAACGPSMIFACNLKLKATGTIDAGIVGLLSFDIHYQTGPLGTDSELA